MPVPLILRRIETMLEHRPAHRRRERRIGHRRPSAAAGSAHARSPRSAGVSPAPAGLASRRAGGRCAGCRRRRQQSRSRSIRAITAPTATVSPTLTSCSPITPATGEGTSTATLSVSRLAIGSSAATGSPGCFSHSPSVASVIDSPERGNFDFGRHRCSLYCRGVPRRLPAAGAAMAERVGDQRRLLGRVPLGEAGRGRGRGGAARHSAAACP